MSKPTIVLVHGAWADGSSWNAVASHFRDEGHTVFAPPNLLRGVGTDAAYSPRSSPSAPRVPLCWWATRTAASSSPTPALAAVT